MATDPSPELQLTPLRGEPRTLDDWTTTFAMFGVVLDPYTHESSWIVPTAGRLMLHFQEASVRNTFLLTCSPDQARTFLGPWADRVLTLCDPDRELVKNLGLEQLPALVYIGIDGSLIDSAEGWEPRDWRRVAAKVAEDQAWTPPLLPKRGDPAPYAGSPALT